MTVSLENYIVVDEALSSILAKNKMQCLANPRADTVVNGVVSEQTPEV